MNVMFNTVAIYIKLIYFVVKKKGLFNFDAKMSGCSLSQKYKELVPDFGAPPTIRFGSFTKIILVTQQMTDSESSC